MKTLTVDALVEQIQDKDDNVRAAARDGAGPTGAAAIAPLAKIAAGSDELEVARAANRAIQNIVYYAGRPGADDDAKAVSAELIKLISSDQPVQLRRDFIWMTWQICGEEAVEPVAALLENADLREDARMALERLPGDKATAVLKKALAGASDAEKPAFAHSLGNRGVEISGLPDLRLKPTKKTSVTPVGR